ncbi:hypothetical protein V9T40_001739 [Parthenolecanium corni]|uniref:alpha-1,2-Mannosidase n=1 Tax=Parthenolecanium corni TaxID=536013 RepID=A0AAN9TH47_9HEMI
MFIKYRLLISLLILPLTLQPSCSYSQYSRDDILRYREEVRQMFNHAYSGYLEHAYPYDELRPLTCDGIDTWGSYSLTLIDALDTLVIMGNYTEFERVVDIITNSINFDINMNVSVFETNIRVIGGLLSAHILSHKAGIALESDWPCNGPLLRLAEDVANRLLPAFDTPTGMPYGTVNLKRGVPPGETTITCTAGIGTFILEFGTLSRLTGDPIYEEIAMNALRSLFQYQSKIGLVGNHIDVMTGMWTAQDSGIGAGIDSYFEYLVKGGLLFNKPELMSMFSILEKSVNKYLRHNDWFFWVSMQKGLITLPLFQSLEAYWPGILSHIGNLNESIRSIHNYHHVWKRYGFTPEFYNIIQQEVSTNRESYPLRPELIESVMYLYRATGDPYLLDVGVDILKSIQHSAVTSCGYATIKDCRDHAQDNRMESFFLAETTKYLYLLFDPDNFIHNQGEHGRLFRTASGESCVIDAGGFLFNTEAHPIDPGVLRCCPKKPSSKNESATFSRHLRVFDANLDALEQQRSSKPLAMPDVEMLAELNSLREHIDRQLKAGAERDRRKTEAQNRKYSFGNPLRKDVCTRQNWLKFVFFARRTRCERRTNFIDVIEDIRLKFASFRNEVRLFKDYLLNKTEFTGDNYDPQVMLERILQERRHSTTFASFTELKLLYCKPQQYIQRLSFLGQFFNSP